MTTFREQNQRRLDTVGFVELLEIENPSFSGLMQIANATEDFVSNGVAYIALPFGFTIPEDNAAGAPRLLLSMNNVGRGIADELERIVPGTTTMAKFFVVARNTPNKIEYQCWLPLTNVSVSGAAAQATAGVDEMIRQSACKQRANPFTLPGIF